MVEKPVASIPVDLALAAGGYGVVARFSAYPDELNPALGGRDWYRFSMRPVQMVGSGIGGKGVCAAGADALEVVGLRSVSISQDVNSLTPAGFVHFVHLQ